mmetsp:Transcript_19015/g.56365  ORF Transcript_19015/g.56365 Transcript_19015/m.56365 type:complete len:211 (-) Transcript_19015:57-689(-)
MVRVAFLCALGVPLAAIGVAGFAASPQKIWRTLFNKPYKGDAVLLEIFGADLGYERPCKSVEGFDTSANKGLENWFKGSPDCYVRFRHGRAGGRTQVEGGTFHPRFYFQRKMPWFKGEGFEFQVWESDVFSSDKIVGRCFLNVAQVKRAMKARRPVLMSLGSRIGHLKVAFHGPISYEDRQGKLLGAGENRTCAVINAKRGGLGDTMIVD